MKIDENYVEKLCNAVAKTILESFENLSIEDVNMYQLGYNKAIECVKKLISERLKRKCDFNSCDECEGCCEIDTLLYIESQLDLILERN